MFQTKSQGSGALKAIVPDITVQDGVVYVGSKDNTMYAIDAQTGQEIWSRNVFSDVNAAATLSEDGTVVFVGTESEGFLALDTENGSKRWDYNPVDGRGFDVKPTVSGHTVIAASSDGRIYAFDGDPDGDEEGKLLWTYPKPPSKELGLFREAGLAYRDAFYIGNDDGTLHGVSIDTGLLNARARLRGDRMPYYEPGSGAEPEPLRSQVVRSGENIYLANDANEVIQYDGSRIRWVYNTLTHRPVRGAIAATEDIVVVADRSGAIHALNPDRQAAERKNKLDDYDTPERLWREFTEENAQIIGGPVVAGDWVFVIDGNGVLYMIDVERGRTRYSLDLWEGTSPCVLCKSSPAVEGDMLFAGTQDGTILGIQLPEYIGDE